MTLNKNIAWSLFDRCGRLLIAFCVGVIVARMLTPEIYGVFTLANALVAVVSFLSLAAMEAVVVRMLVREPSAKEEILGSAFLLRLIGGASAIGVVVLIIPLSGGAATSLHLIAPILASVTLFSAMDIGEYWLRQAMTAHYGIIARHTGLLAGAAGRIWAAQQPEPLLLLALVIAAEAMVVLAGLSLALARARVPPWHWQSSWRRCRQLLTEAWPMLLAAAAVGLYVRVGAILLSRWHGPESVGLFGVATILVEATHALPVAIMAIMTPILISKSMHGGDHESLLLRIWLRRMTWLGIGVAVFFYALAPLLVPLLFGHQYDESIRIFSWLIWSAPFVYISCASEVWLITRNLQRYVFYRTLVAAAVNILLNFILIPSLGAHGVALATILTYSISGLLGNALFQATRPLFRMQLAACLPIISRSDTKLERS